MAGNGVGDCLEGARGSAFASGHGMESVEVEVGERPAHEAREMAVAVHAARTQGHKQREGLGAAQAHEAVEGKGQTLRHDVSVIVNLDPRGRQRVAAAVVDLVDDAPAVLLIKPAKFAETVQTDRFPLLKGIVGSQGVHRLENADHLFERRAFRLATPSHAGPPPFQDRL